MFAGLMTVASSLSPREIVDTEAWQIALSPFHRPDLESVWEDGPALLVETRVFNSPESHAETLPCRCPQSGVTLAFWGRLDNREALAATLAIGRDHLTALADSQLVLAAWRRWGEALPEHLLGDFVLAVLDPIRRRVFLARDPLGIKPLYYRLDGKALIFATTAAAFPSLKTGAPAPDLDWMARFLADLSMSDHQTGLTDVVKLPPGHSLVVDERGAGSLRRWFTWRDDPPPAKRRDRRWVEQYQVILEEAIRCRMGSAYPLGTENSGGIDSATITAYLAHFLGEPGDRLHSFGFALCEQEPALILETSQHRHIVHNYLITALQEQQADALYDRTLTVLGYPEEHGNGSGHIPFYQECALRGIRTLFSGFGGDEVVTNPGYQLRLELLDAGHYSQLWDILPGNTVTRALRLAKALATQHKQPAYNARFLAAWNARWPQQLLREEVVQRLGIYDAYMETARFDAPYRRINDFILQNRLAPFVATRLENCTLMAASYGVDYRWPLWDVRLVQQYLSTPSIEKMGPKGIGRYLHRRAIDKVVPTRVAWKPSKDMGHARLQQQRNSTAGLASTLKQAQQQQAHLHPALASLIDSDKFRQQILQAKKEGNSGDFTFSFRQNISAIHQLNHWLHGESVD